MSRPDATGGWANISDDLKDCGGSTHGSAVAESVIDIAPDVSLYIADPDSIGDLRDTVDWMISEGVSVINHSRTWLFDGPGDGTSQYSSSPLNTVDRAVEAGIVWVNAAGNSAQLTWFQRGPFSYTTISVDGEEVSVINFEGANFRNRFQVWGSLQLRWDDTWGEATRDFDLYLVTPGGGGIALASMDPQSGEDGHDPYERVVAYDNYDVVIAYSGGSEPGWIQLLGWQGRGLTYGTPESGSIISPAESANPGMMSVGAAHWQSVNSIESYSSRGPTPDGRIKPDAVAAACGQTAARSSDFCGTSQASPHVAGMAALVRQRFPAYSAAEVVSYLEENADQRINSPDPNSTWGHGFIVLPPPSAQVSGAPSIQVLTPGANSLTVEWNAPSDDGGSTITAYDLRHVGTSADETVAANWTVVQDAWTGSGALSYELTGLEADTQYDVQVRAVNSTGDGAWSPTFAGTTTAAVTLPGTPTGLTATTNGQTQIDLSWTAPSDDGGSAITGYRIEVSADGSSWSDLVGDTRSTTTTYGHTGLTPGTMRHYRVSAINSAGTGSASNVAVAATGIASAPDLVVDTPTVDTSAPAAGARFTLSAAVRNQGNGRSESTTLRYYQSADAIITTGDTEIDTNSVFRLDASESGEESARLTAPSTPGTYYFGTCVDAVTGESDTTNNCSIGLTVTVGAAPAPDLVVDVPTVSDNNPTADARITLDATVRNQGSGRSDSTTLRYYQSADSTITTGDTEIDTDYVSRIDASGSGNESVRLAAPATPGTYYYGACADVVQDELDTTNNCSAAVQVTVGAAPAPDLVVDAPAVSDSNPTAGARITLSAAVRNQGSGRSDSTTLRYYQSTDSTITAGDIEVGTDSVFRLGASARGNESVSLTAPAAPGTYYYGACVDGVSGESDTTNNCSGAVAVTVGAASAPDLVVDAPTVSDNNPAAGARFTLSATVRNRGGGRSDSTTLRYYQSTDSTITAGDMEVGNDSVSGLSASGSGAESVNLTAPSASRSYYYGACVDTVTGESDTTNNCSAAVAVTIGSAPGPDLVVESIEADNNTPFGGTSFTLKASVRNRGGVSSPTTRRYYQSADSTISTSDTEIGTNRVSGLVTGGLSGIPISLTAPTSPGTYYYGACVDPVPNESNTSNNCSSALTVTVPQPNRPDLIVSSATVDDTTPDADSSFTFSVQVRNRGDGASTSTTLRYYMSTDASVTTADTPVGTDTVAALTASGISAEDISLTAPSAAGTYYYGACVDAISDESITANNCSTSVAVTVAAAESPDLIVSSVSASGSSFDAGSPYTVYATVRNQGNASSGVSTTLTFRLSTDATISSSDKIIKTIGNGVGAIAPSKERQYSDTPNGPLTPGTYYYGACVEPVPGESDADNNCSDSVAITFKPDLFVGAAYSGTCPSPHCSDLVRRSSFTQGEAFKIFSPVALGGDSNAANIQISLRYYQSTDSTITSSDTEVYTRSLGTGADSGNLYVLWGDVTAPSPGTYYYGVCVDAIPSETNTANNCSSAVTVTVEAATASAPSAPTGLSAAADGQTEIDLSWSAPSADGGAAITGYKIEVSTDNSSWSVLVADTSSKTTSYSHTGLSAGSTRYYRVSAINSAGTGTASNVANATTDSPLSATATAPGAPTGLTATANGQTRIDLSWTTPSNDGGASITGYKIEVSTDNSSWSVLVADSGSTAANYSHTGLMAGSARYYRVYAINSAGTSAASSVANAATDSASVPTPDPPAAAVTGSITDCSGERISQLSDLYEVTITGTLTATRMVTNVRIIGYVDGTALATESIGTMSAEQTVTFSFTRTVLVTEGSCEIEVLWVESN